MVYTSATVQDYEHYNLLLSVCDLIEGTTIEIDDFLDQLDAHQQFTDLDDYELCYMIACAGRLIWVNNYGWMPFSSLSKSSRRVAEDFIRGVPVHGDAISNLEVVE